MADRFRIVERVLREELAKPYRYGVADCFMLGCRVADALEDTSRLAERYGGSYSTLAGAQRALRRAGFKSLPELFRAHLPEIPPAAAQTGDLAILLLPEGGRMTEHVAVVAFASAITKTERGRQTHGVAQAIAAFRTGGPA